MIVLPFLAAALAHIMCIIATVTDIRNNKISNYLIITCSLIGIILDIAQYVNKTHILWPSFLINLAIVVCFSILLYVLHIWAAGDSKLLIALGIILPANYCLLGDKSIPWSVFVVALSFIISFLYLILESLWLLFTHKGNFSLKNVKKNSKSFLLAYFRNIVYLSFVLKLEKHYAENWFDNHVFVVLGINICIILFVSSVKILHRIESIFAVLVVSILFSVFTKEWFLSTERIEYYALIIFIMLIKVVISEFNYKTIPTADVKKGMILSTFTTIFMSKSRVKGLPDLSHEDMRSRLSEEEAQAVVRWGTSKYGLKEVQIVRKIPYAIFIYLGLIIYSIIWRMSI